MPEFRDRSTGLILEAWTSARELVRWARETLCFCRERRRRAIDCENCLSLLIADAVIEAARASHEKEEGN